MWINTTPTQGLWINTGAVLGDWLANNSAASLLSNGVANVSFMPGAIIQSKMISNGVSAVSLSSMNAPPPLQPNFMSISKMQWTGAINDMGAQE
jgi:hypothetical protein